jgi:PqqD family protein of HPr-rel-A system
MASEALLLKQWPGESSGLVYDASTATTHLLDALACELLDLARKGPSSLEAALASFNGAGSAAQADGWTAADLLPTLQALLHAGLLHPVPAVPLHGAAG